MVRQTWSPERELPMTGKENVNDIASFDFDLLTGAGDGNTWCEQCKKYEQVCPHSTCTNVSVSYMAKD